MKSALFFLFVLFSMGCSSSDNGEGNTIANAALLSVNASAGSANGVIVSGGHADVADETVGIQSTDTSDPGKTGWAGECTATGPALRFNVSGGQADVADDGLAAIEVSNSAEHSLSGTCKLPYDME